jgi:hypothetical protein
VPKAFVGTILRTVGSRYLRYYIAVEGSGHPGWSKYLPGTITNYQLILILFRIWGNICCIYL